MTNLTSEAEEVDKLFRFRAFDREKICRWCRAILFPLILVLDRCQGGAVQLRPLRKLALRVYFCPKTSERELAQSNTKKLEILTIPSLHIYKTIYFQLTKCNLIPMADPKSKWFHLFNQNGLNYTSKLR